MKSLLVAILSSGLTVLCYYSIQVNVFITENVQRGMPHIDDLTTETLLDQGLTKEEIQALRKLGEDENEVFPIIDILSVGSITQQDLQEAQRETFGSHKAVRHFFGATEEDDTEASCYESLELLQVRRVANFCRKRKKSRRYPVLSKISQHFFSWSQLRKKKNPVGWLCAQKRPFDGFYNMIQKYNYRSLEKLPDYLLVLDDDTWVNLENFVEFAPQAYPITKAHVMAGCMMVTSPRVMNLTVPFGGYGIIFNRKALENLMRPLNCGIYNRNRTQTSAQDPRRQDSTFQKLACWRMSKNLVGERALYRDGMSLADLMHAYAVDQPFRNVTRWNRVGFCMHSDWLWAYMANYYHLATRPADPVFRSPMLLHDRLVGYNNSHVHPWTWGLNRTEFKTDPNLMGQCKHGNDLGQLGSNGNGYCDPNAHFCHRITPMHMRLLHTWNEKYFPAHYAVAEASSPSFTESTLSE